MDSDRPITQAEAITRELKAVNRKLERIDTALRGDLEHVGLVARMEHVESEIEKGPKIVARTVGIVSLVVTVLLGVFALIMKA
jgi:hypothetical protein